MTGEHLVTLYQSGHQQQAVDLARAFGGEAERLALEMHRADRACEEIDALAEARWGCAWQAWAAEQPGDEWPPTQMMRFLRDGYEHWEEQWCVAADDLGRLEVTL
jgi:hypothetical protein